MAGTSGMRARDEKYLSQFPRSYCRPNHGLGNNIKVDLKISRK